MRPLLSSMLFTAFCFETLTLSSAEDIDERSIFYGPHSAHLSQLVSFFRLKAVVKAKAYDCKRIHYCKKGAIKSILLPQHPALDELMSYLSENHRGILGALADGYLRKDCEKLYPKCFMKIRVITSKEPCGPDEACFRMGFLDLDPNTGTPPEVTFEENTDVTTGDSENDTPVVLGVD